MTAIETSPNRPPVTLVHVMKKRLRSVLTASPLSDALSPTSSAPSPVSSNASPSTQHSPIFPSPPPPPLRRGTGHASGTRQAAATRRVDPQASSRAGQAAVQSRPGRRPDALPTPDFYLKFPRAVGPLANVVITSEDEYVQLLLIAKRIYVVKDKRDRDVVRGRLCAKDISEGGFFVYQPDSKSPQYFQLHKRAADVYGSSCYVSA